MKCIRLTGFLSVVLMMISCATSETGVDYKNAEEVDALSEIISSMPASDNTEFDWLNRQILEEEPQAVHALVGMLKAPGTGDDTGIRYAVNGLVNYVSKPGLEREKSAVEQIFLQELKKDHHRAVKIFLIEQLSLIGSEASVTALQSVIGDELLHKPAVHTLRAIGSENAASALLHSLPDLRQEDQAQVIYALSNMDLPADQLIRQLSPYTDSNNEAVRDASVGAIAGTGQPGAVQVISEKGKVSDQLHLARRLAEEGYLQESGGIARNVYGGAHPVQSKISALTILADVEEDSASLDFILESIRQTDPELRAAALNLGQYMQGADVVRAFETELEQSEPAVRADIIAMLGRRGDRSSWMVIKPYLKDEDREVRKSAADAAVSLAGVEALPDLFDLLNRAETEDEIRTIRNAMNRLPSESLFKAAYRRWSSATDNTKIALIQLAAMRKKSEYLGDLLKEFSHSDPQVRLAILNLLDELATPDYLSRMLTLISETGSSEERRLLRHSIISAAEKIPEPEERAVPVLSELERASDDELQDLVQILSGIGGEQALNAVIATTENSVPGVRTAAYKALAQWQHSSAIQPLLTAFGEAEPSDRAFILKGLIRLVHDSKYSSIDKVKFLENAMSATSSKAERKALLEALSDIPSPAALGAAAGYFNDADPEIREHAYQSAAAIMAPFYKMSDDFDAADQMLSLLESTMDSLTMSKMEQHITHIQNEQRLSDGFTHLFNGTDLSGWIGDTTAYEVESGVLVHREGASGNLFTENKYSNFILRFQFRLTPGANNGLAIRSPLEGDPAYRGMELQILDNTAEKYENLEPYQYHGSVYGVTPATRGYLKPSGEWNTQEVIADGSQLTVRLNGVTILDTDLEEIEVNKTMDGRDHPGLLRTTGHIGFLGHGDQVAFRNILIRNLDSYFASYSTAGNSGSGMNQPPEGFGALFNGVNLDGWKGLVENPEVRARMSEQELTEAQKDADRVMEKHWSVHDGILYFDGKGESLVTEKKYKDFEMMLDWKIEPGGDSGVYLRGSPQVQIWDVTEWPEGSGGLYNNQENPSKPLTVADNAIGEWNRMRIKMVGEKVTVHLNGQLVVPGVVLENYWNRDKPIYPEGQLELQAHNTPLYFKNVFIREIPRTENLFNGENLDRWNQTEKTGSWKVSNGILISEVQNVPEISEAWISTKKEYDNFILELEYRLPKDGSSAVFLRAPLEDDPRYNGLEIPLSEIQNYGDTNNRPWQKTGSIYGVKAAARDADTEGGEWQKMKIIADGPQLKVTVNDRLVLSTNLVNHMRKVNEYSGLKHRTGHIGLKPGNSKVEFRNIRITEIK